MSRDVSADLVKWVFETLQGEGQWLALSPSEDELGEFRGRDIDISVFPRSREAMVARLADRLRESGFRVRLINRWEAAQVYVLSEGGPRPFFWNVDLVSHIQWRGFDYCSLDDLLHRPRGDGSRMVSADTHAAYRAIRRWLWAGEAASGCAAASAVDHRRCQRVADEVAALTSGAIGVRLSLALAGKLSGCVAISQRSAAPEVRSVRAALVMRALVRHPMRASACWLGWRLAALDAYLAPRGMVIALLGPDGSGKSMLADKLVHAHGEGLFSNERSVALHWRPGLLPKPSALVGGSTTVSEEDIHSPRSRVPHGIALSALRALYFFADYWLGYWARVRPLLARGGLVVFDRYAFDIVLDPARYRLSGRLLWLYDLLFRRTAPQPDVTIVLDLPAVVAHARKPELGVEEIAAYSCACAELVGLVPNVVAVDADRPLDEVYRDAVQVVVDRYFR